MLRLFRTVLKLFKTIVWYYQSRQVAIILEKQKQWTEKNKNHDGAQLEIPQTITVL